MKAHVLKHGEDIAGVFSSFGGVIEGAKEYHEELNDVSTIDISINFSTDYLYVITVKGKNNFVTIFNVEAYTMNELEI